MPMHTIDEGSGPAIVLLHAYPCDLHLFDAQAAALAAAGHRVLRPDLPGFGRTPLDTAAAPDLSLMAHAVLSAIDAAGVPSFALGGLSMGGYVAMELLRRVPQRITALALLDTKATADGEAARQVREVTATRILAAGSLAPLADGMLEGLLGATTRAAAPQVVAQVRAWIDAADPASCAWAQRAMAGRPDSLPDLAAFPGPALVLAGEEDVLAPAAEQAAMAAALTQAATVMVPGAGHLAAVEAPQAVTDALLALLARVG
jgi:pimeloyl-ACP methyl ester carboxylesterase